MRPRGEIRAALASAAEAYARAHVDEHGRPCGLTWRQLARLACVGFDLAKATVKNMATAGELVPVGEVREPGSRRAMVAYVPSALMPVNAGGVAV